MLSVKTREAADTIV